MRKEDLAHVNKIAITCQTSIVTMITMAYILEVIKGRRSVAYVFSIALLALVPVAVEIFMYFRNKSSIRIKRVLAICYALLYAVVLFTAQTALPFTYAIPMLFVITLYCDPFYCLRISVGAFILNCIDIAYRAFTVGYEASEVADLEIRMALMGLVMVYLFVATRVVTKINNDNANKLRTAQQKTQKFLDSVMLVSGEMANGIELVSEQMEKLDKSAREMKEAMAEVSTGSQETAESVQKQLIRTEEIQHLIGDVGDASKEIREGMQSAFAEIEGGMNHMKELAVQAQQSRQANTTVVGLMNELRDQTEKMEEIVTMITSVANSTSMLALNASIEAARAGEAGKGFAVVASQIGSLSDQTKKATVNITDLIHAVVSELREVSEAVGVLEENTNAQDEKAEAVGTSFQIITDKAGNVVEKAKQMQDLIENLANANGDIVQNIQTISAATEQVTAHTNSTMDTCLDNTNIVNEVSEVTLQLSNHANELKSMQETQTA